MLDEEGHIRIMPQAASMALFALHTFLLMGTGTWSDLAMAGKDFGTTLYYAREGVLVAGFLAYAAFARWRAARPLTRRGANGALVALAVLFAACVAVQHMADRPEACALAALAIALLVGVSGGMAYELIALSTSMESSVPSGRAISSDDQTFRELGVVVGGGGAIAVVLQSALQSGRALGDWLPLCFVVCFCLVMWIVGRVRQALPEPQGGKGAQGAGSDSRGPNAGRDHRNLGAAAFVCTGVVTICLIALFVFYEVLLRASGAVNSFYEWHRLFLAVGYIGIGATSYAGGRTTASVTVMVAALFAVIVSVQASMLEAGPWTRALFYTLLGASLAWSAISFMSVAAQSARTALVASMWRILVGLVTLVGSLIQAMGDLSMMAVLASSLVLLAVIVIAMAKGGSLAPAGHVERTGEDSEPSAEARVEALARDHGLTDREQEVLVALVLTEEKNQQIADDLHISRRQLQTYISRIYEKTGVTTRAGLVGLLNGHLR